MLNTPNCTIAPAHITLRLKGGIVDYKIFGYALCDREQDLIYLYYADKRKNAAMIIPKENIENITAEYR